MALVALGLLAACEAPVVAPQLLNETGTSASQAEVTQELSATPTVATPTAVAATATPQAVAPTEEPTPDPTVASVPTEEPPVIEGDLGLGAGAAQLVAALGAAEPCSALHFTETTLADGTPAWVGLSPDGHMIAEIIGPEQSPVTASLAVLLPEGDDAAREAARAGLYQLIGAAMPERAWATAWLDERIEDALDGTPYSATHGEHYVQVVRLASPQPCITIAVTLAPQTLSMPTWEHLGEASAARVDTGWDWLPMMADPLRGQHLPTDRLDLYEYTVAAGPDQVTAFYEVEMPALGWELVDRAVVEDPTNPGQQQIVLVYRRGAEGALVTIECYAALQETLVTLGYAVDAADLPTIVG